MLRRWIERALVLGFGPSDPIRLDAFSRCLALVLFVYIADRSRTAYEWLTARGYHPSAANEFDIFPAPLPLLPAHLVPWFLLLFLGSTLGVVWGWQQRKLIGVVLACLIYVSFADFDAAFSLNKVFIASFTILLLRPPRRRLSDDPNDDAVESAWALRLLQAQIIVHYFMAGVCKAFHGDWIVDNGLIVRGDWSHWAGLSLWFAGNQDDVLLSHVVGVYRTEFAAWLVAILPLWAWMWMQHSALVFELSAPLLLTVRRLRWLGIVWGVGFHVMIALCMYKVGFFNAQMVCFFLLFLPPTFLRRAARRLRQFLSPILGWAVRRGGVRVG